MLILTHLDLSINGRVKEIKSFPYLFGVCRKSRKKSRKNVNLTKFFKNLPTFISKYFETVPKLKSLYFTQKYNVERTLNANFQGKETVLT